MHDYKKTVDSTDFKLNKSLNSADAFKKAPSYDSATSALNDMKELNKAETKVFYHPLFTVYNFCEPADYAIPQQIEARRVLLDYLDENCLFGEENGIINQSIKLGEKLNALENITIEKNDTIVNITEPAENITINKTNITETPELNQSMVQERTECCSFGVCSIGGIERIGGLCWEGWILIFVLLILGLAVILTKGKK
jgi:hypothetical protein